MFLVLSGGAGRAGAPFSGDCGVKLWQASSAATLGQDLQRAMPDGMSESDFNPPLTRACGRSLRAVFPWSFALVTGLSGLGDPLGMRFSVLVMTALSVPLLAAVTGGGWRGLGAFVLAGLPPYQLVFWEHGPAVTLFLAWLLMFTKALESPRGSIPWWILPLVPAISWRVELAIPALVTAAVLLAQGSDRPGFRIVLLQSASAAAATAILFVVRGERLLPDAMRATMTAEGRWDRLSIMASWFAEPSAGLVFTGFVLWLLAPIGWLTPSTVCGGVCRLRGPVSLVGAAVLVYYFSRGSLGLMSLFMLTPGLALAWASEAAPVPGRPGALVRAGLLSGLAIFLTTPTDGMFQYGPRFLLGPLVLTAAGLATALAEDPRMRARTVFAAAVLLSLWGGARGVLYQEWIRKNHQEMADAVGQLPEGVVVATDENWVPLAAWEVSLERPLLFAGEGPEGIAERLPENCGLIWLSSRTIIPGGVSSAGYRGLKWSGALAEGLPPPGRAREMRGFPLSF
ncbi:hypothetical protein GX411_00175 [Candidatus Fermentibacteria bacterium]|nr:hypothetical protein [Candidatus Fermentibacteria bacterium]